MMLVWHSTEVPMIAIGADGKQASDEQRVGNAGYLKLR